MLGPWRPAWPETVLPGDAARGRRAGRLRRAERPQQVRQTVTDFGRAVANKDYKRICKELFAPRLTEQLRQVNLACEAAMTRAFDSLHDPRVSVGAVKVDGTNASAQVRSSAAGEAPSQDTIGLVKLGGRWRISSLGGP